MSLAQVYEQEYMKKQTVRNNLFVFESFIYLFSE